jgi:major membrane immunogen (membrane-anchored lipoprotein)
MSDYRHRLVKAGGASSQTFSYEDGKGYRGYHFDTEAVKDHVKYKQDQAQYYKKDWRYVGSIPMEMLTKYQITLPEDEQADFFHRFATDTLTKQKFIRWLKQNHPGLLPGEKR